MIAPRFARALPQGKYISQVKKRLCGDAFHNPHDALGDDVEVALYGSDPYAHPNGGALIGFECPTCRFATIGSIPPWRLPFVRLQGVVHGWRCDDPDCTRPHVWNADRGEHWCSHARRWRPGDDYCPGDVPLDVDL